MNFEYSQNNILPGIQVEFEYDKALTKFHRMRSYVIVKTTLNMLGFLRQISLKCISWLKTYSRT